MFIGEFLKLSLRYHATCKFSLSFVFRWYFVWNDESSTLVWWWSDLKGMLNDNSSNGLDITEDETSGVSAWCLSIWVLSFVILMVYLQ